MMCTGPYDLVQDLNEEQTLQLFTLFEAEWWTNRRTLDETRKMLNHTPFIFGLIERESGVVAGFARVLSDQVFKALIMDVIVHPVHRNRGLGTILLDAIRKHRQLKDVGHFELYCLKDMVPFYERWGFTTDLGDVRFMRAES